MTNNYKEYGFSKKSKGNAKIYTHPALKRSIVEKIWENPSFSYNGKKYNTFEDVLFDIYENMLRVL